MARFGEKVRFRKIGEDSDSSFARRMIQESLFVIMIEQEQFCVLPTTELRKAEVGRDRHRETHRTTQK